MPEKHGNGRIENIVELGPVKTIKHPSLKMNAISNGVVLCVQTLVGLFLLPAVNTYLDEKQFGMWILTSSLVGYFSLLRLGVGTGVLRYVPFYRGKGNTIGVDETISTGMVFYVGVGFVIFVSSFFSAGMISDFFQGGPELKALIRIVGLAVALDCPSLLFDTAIRGFEGFVCANMVGLLEPIVRAALILGCIYMGYGLIHLGWSLVAVSLILLIARGITFKSYCKEVNLEIKSVNMVELGILLSYGIVVLVAAGADVLTYEIPKQVIGKIISLEAVGFFGVVALLVGYYRQAIYSVTRVFMPRFSYLSGNNADNDIRRLFIRGSTYTAIIAGAIAVIIWTVGAAFLRLWLTKSFESAIPALMILTCGAMVLVSHRMSIDLMYGLGKQNLIAILGIIEGVGVVGLCVPLSYKYGLTGAAIGVSIPLIVIRAVVQVRYICKLVKIGFWEYYQCCIFKSWVVSAGVTAFTCVVGIGRYADGWVSLFVISGTVLMVYIILSYFVTIEKVDRIQIKRRISAILGKTPNNENVF